MRISIAAACVLVLALAAPASASHQYRSTAHCATKSVRSVQIVTTSSAAIAFRKRKQGAGGTGYVTYACLRRGGAIHRLKGSEVSGSRVRPVFAGRFVGFKQIFVLTEFGSPSGVVVQDLRTGAITTEAHEDGSSLHAFVLKRNGSVAWVDFPEDSNAPRVWKADSSTAGAPLQLDASPEVDFESLRLSSDRRQVLWTRDGAPQSAPID
jgi:hypothetical protein